FGLRQGDEMTTVTDDPRTDEAPEMRARVSDREAGIEDSPPPRVTVAMPVYNGADYIERALDSLLAQDFEDFELIISDNGSTDGTDEIARRYAERDPRISYHRV